MQIIKNINHNNKAFTRISDNTKDIDSTTLFVLTKQNQKYTQNLTLEKQNTIESKHLNLIFSMPKKIIGITGTNGKTTTAAIIYSLLLDMGYSVALLGTRGFFINEVQIKPKGLTTPSILELYENFDLAKECDYFVMEVSSHAICQDRIAGISFALKALTNITSDHLDFHKTIEEYRAVKNSFFSDETLKVINADEANARFNLTNAFTYGIESKSNLKANAFSLNNGINAHISWNLDSKQQATQTHLKMLDSSSCVIDSTLFGKHNLYNILCAIACVRLLSGADLESVAKHLEHFGGVSGRMEVISQKPLIIVDFAHTHDGMEQIFESFKDRRLQGDKIIALFGAGGDRDVLKRPKMGAVAAKYADRIYLTSDNPRSENADSIIKDILQGIDKSNRDKVIIESNRKKALSLAIKSLQENEILLVLGKGDECVQIIGESTIPFDDRQIIRELLARI